MSIADGSGSSSLARVLSPAALLLAWAIPAAVCGLVLTGVFFVDPFAGGIVGIAGIAYLATSLVLAVGVIALRQASGRRPRPPVVVLTATWTAAWLLGVLAFGLVALLLGALDHDSAVPREGFVISPVFWLLSFPMYVVFLLSALLRRGEGGRFRNRPKARGAST